MSDEKEWMKPSAKIVNFETRKSPRISVNLPIEYYLVDSSTLRNGKAINASEGGLLVTLPEELETGQHLRITIFVPAFPDKNMVEITSQIVWREIDVDEGPGHRYGIKIVNISSEDMRNLKNFFKTLSILPNSH